MATAQVPSAPAATKKDIVIVGGSFTGIPTAHYILRHIIPALPNPETYHVTLIDPSTKWVHRIAAPRSLVSEKLLPRSKWMLELKDGFTEYKPGQITIVQGTAVGINTSARTVTIELHEKETSTLEYYALVIATGAASATPLYSSPYNYTVTESAIEAFQAKLSAAKSIVIAGGGPAAVETAGELGHYLNGPAGWFSARPSSIKTKITLVTSSTQLLSVLRPALGKKAETLLNKVGVDVIYGTAVASTVPELAGQLDSNAGIENVAAPAKITLANGEILEADLYIPAYGLKPNSSWISPDLLDAKGSVNTSAALRVDQAGPRVYAVGEIANYGVGGAMEAQMHALPVLFVNIKRDLLHDSKVQAAGGDEKAVPVTGKDNLFVKGKLGETQLVPVGLSKGVGALFGWKLPSFFVWFVKGRGYLTDTNVPNLKGELAKSEQKWKEY
jgi:NADH dehydrogenase FAD-containing subunit